VGVHGVLDGERVQPELGCDTREFGLGRLVQADPGAGAPLLTPTSPGTRTCALLLLAAVRSRSRWADAG
jgi:hypothetical protein